MPTVITQGAASAKGYGFGARATAANYIEDVFSTYLYTGNSTSGGTQTITNNVDLSTKGGMVWIKGRSAASNNVLFDTARGAGTTASNNQALSSNSTDSEDLGASYDFLSAFNTDGFTVTQGGTTTAARATNYNNVTYASWTFRKQAKFFDVVTYTGDNVDARQISHSLGSTPGCIIVKNLSSAQDWMVWHRSLGTTGGAYYNLRLNTTAATVADNMLRGANSTTFTVSNDVQVNGTSSNTYVAYLFAHDAGGFGATGSDNVISCGSYTGTGAAGNFVSLGYEPQWVLIKRSDATQDWFLFDNMRGIVTGTGGDLYLNPNTNGAEGASGTYIAANATGFTLEGTTSGFNSSGGTYIYIAIRRGPMKTPTVGTSVFAANYGSDVTTYTTNFPLDSAWDTQLPAGSATSGTYIGARLLGGNSLVTTGSAGENTTTPPSIFWQSSTSYRWNTFGNECATYAFRRAPSFFDVVCYTGNGTSGRTVTHNLTVAPELIIARQRTGGDWYVYSSGTGATKYLVLNSSAPAATDSSLWNNTSPTSSVFTLGNATGVNRTATDFVAYLFATVAGVSKVGSYTGTGTTKQIDCGFTGGARFVLIKRTDGNVDWYVYDSARGIVAGNDPYYRLNTTGSEVTNTDYVDTYSAGFELSSTAPAALNANGGTYIFLAIA